LIVRNIGRLSAITMVGDFVVWVGKVSIALSCAGLAYLYIVKFQNRDVNGYIFPILFASWISYITASLFLSLISAAANTMLQCFIAEEEAIKCAESAPRNEVKLDSPACIELKSMEAHEDLNPFAEPSSDRHANAADTYPNPTIKKTHTISPFLNTEKNPRYHRSSNK
jgi:Plasma-membrane choline transporter